MSAENDRLNMEAQKQLFNFVLKTKSAVQAVTKIALRKVGERLVYYSVVGEPVYWKHTPHKGYTPGHFINNWQMGMDAVPSGEISGVDPTGSQSLERMEAAIPRWPVGHTFHFANNVPYAVALENGHSLQTPPGGMVGRVVMEFKQIAREAELEYLETH